MPVELIRFLMFQETNQAHKEPVIMELKFIAAFALVALLNAMSPGPSLALLAKSLSSYGVMLASANIVGLALGLIMHGTLLLLGVSELLLDSRHLFTVVKLLGASYLCWLGSKALMKAWRGSEYIDVEVSQSNGTTYAVGCREGFLTSSLNPYTYLFYFSVFPQFLPNVINPESALLMLISMSVMMSIWWYCTLVWLFDRFKHVIGSTAAGRWINVVSGIWLIVLGLFMTLNI